MFRSYKIMRIGCRQTLNCYFSPGVNCSFPFSSNSSINQGLTSFNLFSRASSTSSEKKNENTTSSKSPNTKVYITLYDTDNIPKTSTLDAAVKLSKRRNLRLIKVSDSEPKRGNPVYKLMTGVQVLGEEILHKKQNKGKTGFKSEKIITFSCNISDHDLNSKLQQILKWIQKRHEVRATITGSASDTSQADSTYQKIEAVMKDKGRILQKRKNGTDIKFQIIPFKENLIEDDKKKAAS